MNLNIREYSKVALPHLEKLVDANEKKLNALASRIVTDVQGGRSLFVYGSGHSALLPLEVYHRAGGPSFVIPLVADFFLPIAGPPLVRFLERTPGSANFLLSRSEPRAGEMVWLFSQSGINASGIDLALAAEKMKLHTVAFTSLVHSQAVTSRHPSGKKLFEVCHDVVDLGGFVGDAAIPVSESVSVGPLSSLGGIFLAHSILTAAMRELEEKGIHCSYTSVNTPAGELRNRDLENQAKQRDPLLR